MNETMKSTAQTPCVAGSVSADYYDVRKQLLSEREYHEIRITAISSALAFLDANPGLAVAHDRLTMLIHAR